MKMSDDTNSQQTERDTSDSVVKASISVNNDAPPY